MGSNVLCGQQKADFVRVEGAKVVARAETTRGSIDQFVAPDGSLFAGCGDGLIRFESGTFRYSHLHWIDSTVDVAGDDQNVYVLGHRGTVLRKRRTAP